MTDMTFTTRLQSIESAFRHLAFSVLNSNNQESGNRASRTKQTLITISFLWKYPANYRIFI